MRRRALLLVLPAGLSASLAACGGDGPVRTSFPPLRYDYLTKLQLNVATIDYGPLPPPGPLDATAPVPPGPALLQLVQDRLAAAGGAGHATVTFDDVTLARGGDTLVGSLGVRVEVKGADGASGGFAEATVRRQASGVDRDLRGATYDLVRQMLDDMNVELEFQLRKNLRDWIVVPGAAPAPAPVEQQDLGPPS